MMAKFAYKAALGPITCTATWSIPTAQQATLLLSDPLTYARWKYHSDHSCQTRFF